MFGNGHLGVWLAERRDLAECSGSICLDVNVRVDNPYIMTVQELSSMNDKVRRLTQELDDEDGIAATERRFYTAYQVELLVHGYDIVYLEEKDGRIDIAIGLVLNKLSIQ